MFEPNIKIPKPAEFILNHIHKNGHSGYLVGGCVRDTLLGRTPKDWDIATSMRPDDIISLFQSIPYTRVLTIGAKHGTVTVIPPYSGEMYEVTTFRSDGTYSDGRHPDFVRFANSIQQDLSRRDLTINAMAYSPHTGFIDPYDGRKDLEQKLIRTVGTPDDRFQEDALRMLRAVRFCAQLNFCMDPTTEAAILRCAHLITKVSQERRTDEILKILMSNHPGDIQLLEDTGLMSYVLPEIHNLYQTPQNNPWHIYKDVGRHTMAALSHTPADKDIRLAVLFHDIGKAITRTVGTDGYDHFHGHPGISCTMAEQAMRRMKLPLETIDPVCQLIVIHDEAPEPTEKCVRRFAAKHELTEELFRKYHAVVQADGMAQNPELACTKLNNNDRILSIFQEIQNQPMKVTDLKINGNHLLELGYRGPEIGIELRNLLEMVLDDPKLNVLEELLFIAEADLDTK